ncbi:MAG: metalloregulator ArsR/SmtB family transcription factor [Myxococcales bacterium]|nr:metalloregulator ArsR/SmtB family transcription factor [Myxococcales bacterium]
MLSSVEAADLRPYSRAFRALGDETRLRIVALLSHGELCVCHVEQALGLSQPTVSRSMGILRAAGLVDGRRDGSWVYRLVPQAVPALQAVIDGLAEVFATPRVLQRPRAPEEGVRPRRLPLTAPRSDPPWPPPTLGSRTSCRSSTAT